jgi:predicted RNase H-like HicB family nuclease
MFIFAVKKDGDQFHAYCPELPSCHTFGNTPKEAVTHLKDAIALYVEDVMEEQVLENSLHAYA